MGERWSMFGLLVGVFMISMVGVVSAVDITDCQAIGSSGTYNIINNIVPNVSNCFTISASDIIINGNGNTIINETYNSVAFIAGSARNNVTIKNIGEIKLGQTATAYAFNFASNSNNINIINNTLNNTYLGIRDNGVNNLLFKDNTVYGSWGLGFYYGTSTLDNLTIYNNTFDGITGANIWHFAGDTNNLNVTKNTIKNIEDTSYNFIYSSNKNADSAIIQGNNFTTNTNNNPSGDSYFWQQYGGTFNNSNFIGNTINNAGINGLYLAANSATSNNVSFKDNIFEDVYVFDLIHPIGGINITVTNNTFDNVTNGTNIIYMGGITNSNVSNNIFKNIKDDSTLVYIRYSDGTKNSTISFNQFTNNTPSIFGGVINIHVTDANTTNIFNNTWENSTSYYSIQVNGPAYNINVYNNNISCRDSLGSHGSIFREVYNSFMYDNKIYDCNFGILFHNGSRNNNAYGNYIESGDVGLYVIDDAVNNTAYNFTMESVTTAMSFYRYTDRGNLPPANNTVYNFILNNSGTDIIGYNASSIRGTNVIRDVISNDSTNFIQLSLNSTSLILTNVTSESSTENILDTSSFKRNWYLDTSSNINNTNLTITNSTGDVFFSELVNGSIDQQTLLSYENVGGTITWYSNYTIGASASGYVTNTTEFNLTDNINLAFVLSATPTTATEDTFSPGGGTLTYYLTESDLKEGYTKKFGKFWKVNFEHENETHQLKVEKIDSNNKSATITISSDPQTKTLFVGEEWKVNLNNDSYYDLLVRLDNVTFLRANIFIREIDEEIESETIGEDTLPSEEIIEDEAIETNLGLILGGIFIVLVLIAWAFLIGKKYLKKK